MKVFVAGAGGVIGRPLVRQLVAAGHEVTGTTRSDSKARQIETSGATPVVCDAFDPQGVTEAVAKAAPDVIINQLTNLPTTGDRRDPDYYTATNRLRREGGQILIKAAQAAAVKRLVTQSIAFTYLPRGSWVKNETDATVGAFDGSISDAFQSALTHEQNLQDAEGIDGLILRYGFFYGPGTYYAADGPTASEVRRRRFPLVGPATGTFSFVHVDDAAEAAVAAVTQGSPGIYNIVDDEPAALKEWLPVYAEALGAKPPRRVPAWLARLVAGKSLTESAINMRGASNAKAKAELGWRPSHSSWRQGFSDSL
ncbi:MAG: NAD(P)-dependent oxidoreductase [Thermoleophilia bacterium]|nr:NAD(P)-dependent oxidoreductase [Thermoleophilia bacterium]